MLKAATAGRMDRVLEQAALLAEPGEAPARFAARECSERAARAFQDGWEARERALGLATSGAAFKVPGRTSWKTHELKEGFWLAEVSEVYNRTSVMAKLAHASLALRGLEMDENFEKMQEQCANGDADALKEQVAAARDYQLIGRSFPIRLLTSRPSAVLQGHIATTFASDPLGAARCPAVMQLLMKCGKHFNEELGGNGSEPQGPFNGVDSAWDCQELRLFAAKRKSAAHKQFKNIAEVVSEAAVTLIGDKQEALDFLDVAADFYSTDCPPEERRNALQIFKSTKEKLG